MLVAAIALGTAPVDRRFTFDGRTQTIDRADFANALEAEIARPVRLRVGAAVSAERIRAVLRGVTGDVRFHADLTAVTNVIDRHTVVTSPP